MTHMKAGFLEEVALDINFKASSRCLLAGRKAFLPGGSNAIALPGLTVAPSSNQAVAMVLGQLEAITCWADICPSLILSFLFKVGEHILWPSHSFHLPHLDSSAFYHSAFSHFHLRPRSLTTFWPILFLLFLLTLAKLLQGKNAPSCSSLWTRNLWIPGASM